MGIVIALVQKQACGDRALLAAHLAHHWAHRDRKIGLIDLDPRKYLSRWANSHLCRGLNLKGSQIWRLKTDIGKSRAKNDITIIDCPTHPDHLFKIVCHEADFVVAPCPPNAFSTRTIQTIQGIANSEGTPCYVLLNHVSDHNSSYDQAVSALKRQHARILDTELGNRISYHSGFYHEQSLPAQKAEHSGWNEVNALREELDQMLHLPEAA